MGVAGAATGAAASMVIGFVLYLIMIKRGRLTFKFDWPGSYRPDFRMIGQIVRIGLPLATAGIVFSVVYLFMNRITASFGTEAVAALGIGNRCESLSFLICFGFSVAVATLVGQNLGAKTRACRQVGMVYGLITCGITMMISLGFLIPTLIAGIYQRSEGKGHRFGLFDDSRLSRFMAIKSAGGAPASDTLPPMIISVPVFAAFHGTFCLPMNVGVDGVCGRSL
jgi:Na+-driven multidrug efflux pump